MYPVQGSSPSSSAYAPYSAEHKVRQRNSRACDQCRRLRTRCVRPQPSSSCHNCTQRRLECTAEGPEHKRGPPRGYLHALENRLQDAEALLGVLISLPDENLQRLLSTLTKDPLASEILSRVNHGAFGPSGRQVRSWLIDAVTNSDSEAAFKRTTRLGLANDTADPLVTQKTNEWQDQLVQLLLRNASLVVPSMNPPQSPSMMTPSPAGVYTHSLYNPSNRHSGSDHYSSSSSDEIRGIPSPHGYY